MEELLVLFLLMVRMLMLSWLGLGLLGFTGNTLMIKGFMSWNQKRNKLNVGFG